MQKVVNIAFGSSVPATSLKSTDITFSGYQFHSWAILEIIAYQHPQPLTCQALCWHPTHPYFQVRDMASASSIIIHYGSEFHFQVVAAYFSRNASLKRSAPFCCSLPCLFLFTGQQWAGRRKRLKAINFQIKNYFFYRNCVASICLCNASILKSLTDDESSWC
jgi:hypothetical protein